MPSGQQVNFNEADYSALKAGFTDYIKSLSETVKPENQIQIDFLAPLNLIEKAINLTTEDTRTDINRRSATILSAWALMKFNLKFLVIKNLHQSDLYSFTAASLTFALKMHSDTDQTCSNSVIAQCLGLQTSALTRDERLIFSCIVNEQQFRLADANALLETEQAQEILTETGITLNSGTDTEHSTSSEMRVTAITAANDLGEPSSQPLSPEASPAGTPASLASSTEVPVDISTPRKPEPDPYAFLNDSEDDEKTKLPVGIGTMAGTPYGSDTDSWGSTPLMRTMDTCLSSLGSTTTSTSSGYATSTYENNTGSPKQLAQGSIYPRLDQQNSQPNEMSAPEQESPGTYTAGTGGTRNWKAI